MTKLVHTDPHSNLEIAEICKVYCTPLINSQCCVSLASTFSLINCVLVSCVCACTHLSLLREEEAIQIDGLNAAQIKELREKSEKHAFQAEVNRMMKLIINSLYKNKEVSRNK